MRLRAKNTKGAFTLLELLMVIVIIGVVAAVVSPRIGAAMGGGKLRVGTRSIMQSARYARTMALLHQIDIDLIFDLTPDSAKVRVEVAPVTGERADGGSTGRVELPKKDGESGSQETGHPEENGAPLSHDSALSPRFDSDSDKFGSAISSGAQVSAAALAEEIATEIESPGCTFSFEGYTDTRDDSSKGLEGEGSEARIRFNSNGTCRPFAVRVSITDDDALYVMFDILGSAKVSEEAPR